MRMSSLIRGPKTGGPFVPLHQRAHELRQSYLFLGRTSAHVRCIPSVPNRAIGIGTRTSQDVSPSMRAHCSPNVLLHKDMYREMGSWAGGWIGRQIGR